MATENPAEGGAAAGRMQVDEARLEESSEYLGVAPRTRLIKASQHATSKFKWCAVTYHVTAGSNLVLHLLEHLLHLVQLQLAAIVLLERVQLARRDLKLL
jgi:hypothetical protein